MSTEMTDPAKYDELRAFIMEQKDKRGPLMPVMQKAQDIFGALTYEVQDFIAKTLGCPMSDIYGVATFYSQFILEPCGKYIVSVCMGTACYVKGSAALLEELEKVLGVPAGSTTEDRQFTLRATRCLGCCGLAPVIMINDDVYSSVKPEDIAGIIDKYRTEA